MPSCARANALRGQVGNGKIAQAGPAARDGANMLPGFESFARLERAGAASRGLSAPELPPERARELREQITATLTASCRPMRAIGRWLTRWAARFAG